MNKKRFVFFGLVLSFAACAYSTTAVNVFDAFENAAYAIPTFRDLYAQGKLGFSNFEPGAPRDLSDYKKFSLISFDEFEKTLDTFTQLIYSLLNKPEAWLHKKMPLEQLFQNEPSFIPFAQKLFLKPGSIFICKGDLHGDVHSLISFIKDLQNKKITSPDNPLKIVNPTISLIFHGDYVDRGLWGVEVLYLLMLLKINNPENVILIRGNHEDPQITSYYGFNREFVEKFSEASKADRLRCFNKIAQFYNFLPVVLYVGSGTNVKSFIQCNHGGIEFGYNPKEFLRAPDTTRYHWIKKFNRATEANLFTEHLVKTGHACAPKHLKTLCEDFVARSPMEPYVNGFLWHDFTVNPHETISYSVGRGFKFNQLFTQEVLNAASDDQVKLCGIIRAHQHVPSNDDPLMKLLLESQGCASLWRENNEMALSLQEGFVLTLLLSPDSLHGTPNVANSGFTGFDYDTYAVITTGNRLSEYTIKIVNNYPYQKKNKLL